MEDVSKNTLSASSGGRSAVSRIGRKGDARMHKALQARLQNPKLTHVEALIEGGFVIPLDDLRDHVIIDGVSLGQRKNQFCRRLRSMKRNLDGEETSRNSASEKTDDNDEPSQSSARKNKSKRLPASNLPKMMNDSHPNLNPSGEPSHSTSNTPSIPLTNNPMKSQGTHNNNPLVAFPPFVHQIPGSSLSLADAQRAAIESIQQRAEKQSRRRSSLGTTTSAPPQRNSMNSSTSTSMNASHFTNRTTTAQDGEDKRMKFDEARSSVEASMLARHHQHQQQLSQFLSAEHPYQATLMNHFAAGISPSYAAVLNGLAAAYTPSATTTNSSSSGFLSQALAAASVKPTTAIHPQALSLSMMNNPISFSTYLNAFGQQHIQQSEAKSQMDFNNNSNSLIDHKINQLIQKSMPPATSESRNGSEFTRVGEVNSSNSKFDKLRNESYNFSTTTNTNTPNNIRKEGGKEPMKRRDSSSEALQLFARLNASNLEKRRSGRLSETKIQPAADLTSVLLSDPENSSEEEGSVGVNDSHQLSNGKKQKPVSISQTPPPEGEEEEARSAAIRNFHSNLPPSIPCIRVPNIETAIRQYQTDNNEALKQAMRNAGFCPPHTSESSPTFAHFALLAIEEERRRLLKLKANFENKRSEMSSGK